MRHGGCGATVQHTAVAWHRGAGVAWALSGAVLLALGASTPCTCLDNGLGRTPAMGFNTWNAFNTRSARPAMHPPCVHACAAAFMPTRHPRALSIRTRFACNAASDQGY